MLSGQGSELAERPHQSDRALNVADD
jgi:hypothetical protein